MANYSLGTNIQMLVERAQRNGSYWNDSRFDTTATTTDPHTGNTVPVLNDTHCAGHWYHRTFGGGGAIPAGRTISNHGSTATIPSIIGTPSTTITVVSASGNDFSAGTGARTVKLVGQKLNGDGSLAFATETLTLNGVTPVVGTVQFVTPPYAETVTHGTGGTNAGIITITATNGGAVVGKISATSGRTMTPSVHVPIEATGGAYITSIDVQFAKHVTTVGAIALIVQTIIDGSAKKYALDLGYDRLITPDNALWIEPGSYAYLEAYSNTTDSYARMSSLLIID